VTMRNATGGMLFVLMAMTSGCVGLPAAPSTAPTARPGPSPTATVAVTPTVPGCPPAPPPSLLSIGVAPASPATGDRVRVTVVGTVSGGLPGYSLSVNPETQQVLKAVTPLQQSKSAFGDPVAFDFDAVGRGTVELQARVTYEAERCFAGQRSYGFTTASGATTVTVR